MSKYRVMVVDDDPDVRYVVSQLLSLDFETVQASNGLDALEKLERYEPDLLLLDVMMPVMNGFQCCRSIRKNSDHAETPVFFLSASTSAETKSEAEASGSSGFFDKPFNTTDLIDGIRGFLHGHRVPPRLKLFNMRELEKIDATPLRSAASREDISPVSGEVTKQFAAPVVPPDERDTIIEEGGGKKRRVFGKVRSAPPPPPPTEPTQPAPMTPPPAAPPSPGMNSYPSLPTRSAYDPSAPSFSGSGEKNRKPSFDLEKPPAPPPGPPPSSTATPWLGPETPVQHRPERRPAHPPQPVAPPTAAIPAVSSPPPAAAAPQPPAAGKPTAPAPAPGGRLTAAQLLAQRRQAGLVPGVALAGDGPKPRVLVIIDKAESINEAATGLRGLAEFLPLEDPVEAIELIARFQPDIVVMGVRGPKYSGLEIGNMLRSNARLSHTDILYVLTPTTTPAELNVAQRLSGNPILETPLKGDTLRARVTDITRKPGFEVREKKVSYGIYVKEVLQTVKEERQAANKMLEKEAFAKRTNAIAQFMVQELQDYSGG